VKLWILSDLHIEQSLWDLPAVRPDYDVLVAAGDIHFATDAVLWLAQRAVGKPVVYVPGNHEWYGYKRRLVIEEELPAARKLASELGVHFLWDDEVVINGVRFLGTSLWTDYALHWEVADSMAYAKWRMNDHRVIFPRADMKPLEPSEARSWHCKSRAWLTEQLREKFSGRTVVVTHHLPHPRSIAPQYTGNHLNPAYCSDLSDLVESSGAALWVHGHTHSSCNYMAGRTQIVANPKGYGPRSPGGHIENQSFDERLVIEI
jgi:predicted phosphodiesterase